MSKAPARKNRFERHAKSIILVFVLMLTVLAVAITEYVLEKKLPAPKQVKRSIRLKEHPANIDGVRRGNPKALRRHYGLIVDGLEEKDYPFRTDEDGFIRPSKVYDDPDLKIVFLGGSTTECTFVDEGSRFAYLTGVLLGEKYGLEINTFNSGVSGSNSMHSLDILLNKILPMRPDVVVMMHNINDVNVMLFMESYWNDNRSRSVIMTERQNKDRWQLLWETVQSTVIPGISNRIRAAGFWSSRNADEFGKQRGRLTVNTHVDTIDFKANLATFVTACKARDILPVLMTQVNRFKENPDEVTRKNMDKFYRDWGIDYATYKGLLFEFNEIIREVAQKHSIPLVDLEAQIPKDKTHIYDIVHLNTNGSRLAAEIIANTLAENTDFQRLLKKKT